MCQDSSEQPSSLSDEDLALIRELTAVTEQRQRLYEKLDSSLKALFSHCEWRITCYKNGLAELVVICPSLVIYKRLRNRAETIHKRYELLRPAIAEVGVSRPSSRLSFLTPQRP